MSSITYPDNMPAAAVSRGLMPCHLHSYLALKALMTSNGLESLTLQLQL